MHRFRYAGVLAVVAIVPFSLGLALGPKPGPKPVTYASVAPIFKGCAGCHMGAKPAHGLNLTSYANVMKGDKQGKVVVAGKPAASRLSKAVHRSGATPMPPNGPLKPADVAKIDAWIKAGAKA